MKKEEHIKTVLRCSRCGSEILSIKYDYEDYDYASGSATVRTLYKCGNCYHNDTDKTVVKGHITEVIERPYTNEELEEMIKELQFLVVKLDHKIDEMFKHCTPLQDLTPIFGECPEDPDIDSESDEDYKPYKQNIVRPATNVDGKYDWSFDFDEDGYVIDETEKYNVLARDYKKLKDKYDKLRKILGKVLDSKTYGDLTIKEIQIYCDAGLLDCKKCPLRYCEDCDVDFDYCDCSIVIKEEDI